MKRALVPALVALISLVPLAAHAQIPDGDGPGTSRSKDLQLKSEEPPAEHVRSPQHFMFELKFGPYSPNIDSSPGLNGATPFADLFNNQYTTTPGQRPAGKILTSLEIDYQFLHRFGSLAVGASWGIQRRETHSFQYVNTGGANLSMTSCTVWGRLTPQQQAMAIPPAGTATAATAYPGCIRSSDTTDLTFMPFTLLLVYRFDVLALRYRVPIVPYLKGGISYYLWFMQRADGSLSKFTDPKTGNTDKAIGGTFGLVAQPGLALMLDALDPSAARVMDSELGINHTYLFAELNYAWITGFGAKQAMVYSDLTWNGGIAFEF